MESQQPTERSPDGSLRGDRFFSLSLDMLCIAGFDGYFKRLNPAWQRTLGWTADELQASPYLDFVHPDDRGATAAEAGKLGQGAETVSFQNRYRCEDGSYRWLEWTATPEPENGTIYAVARDRTEQKRAEEEILRTQGFLDSIVENIPHMIFVKDATELRFVRFNRAGEELLGYPRAALLGKNDYDFFPKEQADAFVAKDREVLAGKRLVEIPEEPLRTKEKGMRILHTRKLPLLDPQGRPQYLLGISEDITERTRLDTAKSEFLALASHQLRTPLTSIRWTLELLMEEAASLTADQRRLVGEGYEGAVRMAETLQTMLRVTRIESQNIRLKVATVRLSDLLRQITGEYAAAAACKGQPLTFDCPETLAVRTDPELVGEIVGNFLSNAIKYTPPKGVVRVQTRREPDAVTIAVSDTGIGIPVAEQARVFAKLFRASNAVTMDPGGTGLGLYLCASLTRLLGGRLSFVSRENCGTVFALSLPLTPPSHV